MKHWLMKTEPSAFGIDDLENRPMQIEHWDGVRNYQARNMLRDEMKIGDLVFIYHSNCALPGITGIAKVVREGYPDFTAFDPEHIHYDPKSKSEQPIWYMVDVQFVRKLVRTITLQELKPHPELSELALVRRGNRLSIMPVAAEEWQFILALE
jgi:predicted RNA-binding protein with PUA-like domain